ncbi:MAG: ATP-dependent DNA helicase [bacterium]|nr:ATP-dependent DNA helicase [bacterium]
MAEEKKLNEEQLQVIEHGKGPLLVIAGAGTGKTTVITERIKYLVAEGLAKPSEILALTFTDKAAREMEERVDQAMPYGYTQMWISTFHSFCDKILRLEGLNIGLNSHYNLMTGAETVQFLRQNLFKFELNYFRPLGNPTKFIDGMLQHFSRLKDEDVTPEEYLRFAQSKNDEEKEENEKTLELANAYRTYEELKIKEGVMDFDDLIFYTLKLFKTRKNVLKQYQAQFKYVLIDEFQDTNYTQNELAILLAGAQANITATGDDDQSVYKFRGAAISNIIQFREKFPKAKIVVLTKNYRSTQEILDRSYRLIQNNNPDRLEVKEKIDKKLVAMRKIAGTQIHFLHTDRVENEAELVAKKIINLKAGITDLKYSDFAILVRANAHAEAFVRALSRSGIPYQFLGPGMLFKQPEIKELIAYLKVLADINDSVAMFRVLTMDIFTLDARDLAAMTSFAKRNALSLFEACEQLEKIFVQEKTRETVQKIVAMVHKHLALIKNETAGQILYFFLEDSGILRKIIEYKSSPDERRAQNISKFFDKLKIYEAGHEDASVFAVSDWIDLSMELGESPLASNSDWSEIEAVNLLTVHSAKGLEFPVVFLVNLVSQRFPTNERREQIPIPEALIKEILPVGDYHLEEERRLFYVGMTRARDHLFLTAANYYGEAKRERKISQFVVETLGEQAIKSSNQPINQLTNQLSLLEWAKPKEFQFPVSSFQFPINDLSFSQIETFNRCPLQYRYHYIQRIPVTPGTALTFGDTVHKTLLHFYERAKKGEKLAEKDLLEIYQKNWSSFGFSSKEHELKMKKNGGNMLKKFYKEAYDPKHLPESLEQSFKIKIGDGIRIGGKIDRVDTLAGGALEIIDYKTGKLPAEKEIAESLQMTVYALAACDPGIYGKKPDEVILTFYFLEHSRKISSKRTKEQLEEAKRKLVEKAKEIQKSDFLPTPGPWCDFCDFKLLCEAWS